VVRVHAVQPIIRERGEMIKQNFRYFIIFIMLIAAVVLIGECSNKAFAGEVTRSEEFMQSYMFPGWLLLVPYDHYILMSGDLLVAEVYRCADDPDTHSWDWIVYSKTDFGVDEYLDGIAISDKEAIKAAYTALIGNIFT
jgi:hypothetical protein